MDITECISPAVVAILTTRGDVIGTGFFVTADGYILTCYHVIKPLLLSNKTAEIRVKTREGIELKAVFDESKSHIVDEIDFAILKAEGSGSFPCLRLGKDFEVNKHWYSRGYSFSATYNDIPNRGMIFSTAQRKNHLGYDIKLNSETPIRGGASGSPLICSEARLVVGVIKSKPTDDGSREGFAIPVGDIFVRWPELEELNSKSFTLIEIPAEAEFDCLLSNYLNTLLKKYGNIIRPWDKEISSISINKIAKLKLRDVESEVERNNEESSRCISLSDAIMKNQRLLIIGDPGSGKSTSLRWITYTYAEQLLKNSKKDIPVPIYLELKWYKNDIFKLISTNLCEFGNLCNKLEITEWIKNENILFILDGFDELSDSIKLECFKDIRQLISLSGKSRFIVASRNFDFLKNFLDIGFNELEIRHLSDTQINHIIINYLGKEKGNDFSKNLERYNLLNEAKNPLILWFMILEFENESGISLNKGQLFKRVIEYHFLKDWEKKRVFTEYDSQKYIDLEASVLSRLAFFMTKESSSKIRDDIAESIIDDVLKEGREGYKEKREKILDLLYTSHLLTRAGSQISFWHKSFRDYFAALELIHLYSLNPGEFEELYINDLWEEPILFFIGLINKPSNFINMLVHPFFFYLFIFKSNVSFFRLSLAAKCIGANNGIDMDAQQNVIDQCMMIIRREPHGIIGRCKILFLDLFISFFYREECIKALGRMKSKLAVKLLVELWENEEIPTWLFYQALENNSLSQESQNSILKIALERCEHIFDFPTSILRENMTQETALKLIEIALDKKEKIGNREYAIDTLGDYPGDILNYFDIIIDSIIQIALEEESESLRRNAISALRTYDFDDKEEKIINPIIKSLSENPNPIIRYNAAWALVDNRSIQAKKAIIKALDDNDAKVRRRAAYVLGIINIETEEEDKEASRKLLRLFNDNDRDVRLNALDTYGRLYGRFGHIMKKRTEEELGELIDLLNDEDCLVRAGAAEALGEVKAKEALGVLKQMLNTEKYTYPWAYIIWAILRIEPSFFRVARENHWEEIYMFDLLNDPNIYRRQMAATVLGLIGSEKVLPIIKKLNDNVDERKNLGRELNEAIFELEWRIKNQTSYI